MSSSNIVKNVKREIVALDLDVLNNLCVGIAVCNPVSVVENKSN